MCSLNFVKTKKKFHAYTDTSSVQVSFSLLNICFSGRGVRGEGRASGCSVMEGGSADDGKGLEAHFSERRRREFKDDGFSGSVQPLPNKKYISIRGRGLGRGSSKRFLAEYRRADDGKGEEAQRS